MDDPDYRMWEDCPRFKLAMQRMRALGSQIDWLNQDDVNWFYYLPKTFEEELAYRKLWGPQYGRPESLANHQNDLIDILGESPSRNRDEDRRRTPEKPFSRFVTGTSDHSGDCRICRKNRREIP